MRACLAVLLLLLVVYPAMPDEPVIPTSQAGSGRIESALLRCVVKIEAPATVRAPEALGGTGFIVSRETQSGGRKERLLFLITNKHMIGDWTRADGDIVEYRPYLRVFFYGGPGGAVTPISVPLLDESGVLLKNRVRLAADPHVDVAAVLLNDVPPSNPPLEFNHFDVSYLLAFDRITASLTGLGDQVFALGYPHGVTSSRTSYPIAKAGYLATSPGETFAITLRQQSRNGRETPVTLEGKILVIDGLIMPGNSGSPVVLPSELKIRRDPVSNALQFADRQTKNFVIGIVSELLPGSGLTLCFSSDYILDLVGSSPGN